MQSKTIMLCACLFASMAIAQSDNVPAISVKELPPKTIPSGSCTDSASGYLGIIDKNGAERTKMTPQEIGVYVKKRMGQGYVLTLYPQPNGRIFAIAECASKDSREAASQ